MEQISKEAYIELEGFDCFNKKWRETKKKCANQ